MTDPDTCGIIATDFFITGGRVSCECPRPYGHAGPHLILYADGSGVIYEMDLFCRCKTCRTSDNPDDWCQMYREVTLVEVELLLGTMEEGITLVSNDRD